MEPERTDKYWICAECAEKKGWVISPWPVTCTTGLCGHCAGKDKTWLTPIVDFDKPDGTKAIWD